MIFCYVLYNPDDTVNAMHGRSLTNGAVWFSDMTDEWNYRRESDTTTTYSTLSAGGDKGYTHIHTHTLPTWPPLSFPSFHLFHSCLMSSLSTRRVCVKAGKRNTQPEIYLLQYILTVMRALKHLGFLLGGVEILKIIVKFHVTSLLSFPLRHMWLLTLLTAKTTVYHINTLTFLL